MWIQVVEWLDRERRRRSLLAVAALIGLGFAFLIQGWNGINGTADYWSTTHNDSLQGIAALRYYFAEPWSAAILDIKSYGIPTGTNLVITDSIPLLAVPAKAVSGLLPAGFHYFGYWVALSFVLQAVAMVALLWILGLRNYAGAITGSVLALLQTAILTRYFHVALMGQFLLIGAIALGVHLLRADNPRRDLWLFTGLLSAVFFIHLYFFAMVFAIAIGFALQAGVSRRIPWGHLAAWLVTTVAITGTFVAISGLADAAGYAAVGYGFHSMNLLALFGSFDATGGQYEGAAYLGIGAIALVLLVAMEARDHLRNALRRYWAPVIVVLGLAAYAPSTTVWIGETWRIKIPDFFPLTWLGLRFRSSGRFIWPLVYVLVAAAIVFTYRRFGKRIGVPVLMGATLLQIATMSPTVIDLRSILNEIETQELASEAWLPVISEHELVTSADHACMLLDPPTARASGELQRMAASANVPVTAVAVSRRSVDCDAPPPSSPLTAGELRIVWHYVAESYDLPGAYCVDFELGTACTQADRPPGFLDPLAAPAIGSIP